MENPPLELAVILVAAVGAQLLAARFRIPAIVPLLVGGRRSWAPTSST